MVKLKNNLLILVILAAMMALFAGCGDSQSDGSAEPAGTQAASESPYRGVTTMDPAAVEAFAATVRQAYLDEDWAAISELIDYPIIMKQKKKIKNADAFLKYMEGRKPLKSSRKAMEQENCKNLFANGEGICIADGEVWLIDVNFDGIEQTDEPELKIIALQGIR